jgi:hypothetical protein
LLTPLANAFYDVLDIKLADAKKAIAAGQNVEANEDIVFSIENLQRVSPKPNNKPPELTPEQKKAQEGIDREKGELAKSRAAAHTEKVTTSLSTLNTEVDDAIADQFVPALDKAGLTEFEFEQAVIQIGKALDLALEGIPTDPKSGHPYYKETKKQLTAAIERDPSVANIKALKAHELKYRNMKVGPIVKDVLRKATEGPLKRQGERQAKEKAAADASKAEPRGASSAAPAISVKGTGIADSQAAWDADPKNAGLEMPTEWHFARIMGGKK